MQRQTVPLLVPSPAIKQAYMPYCLAKHEACFVGEPVAIVVADSRYLAEDAAALVEIDYEPLPAVSDCVAALKPGAPLAHRDASSNLAAVIPVNVGNAEAAFAQAPHVFREQLFQHRGGPFFLECRGMIAVPDPMADALTIYVSSQGPHRHKRVLLDLLDWADHQLRIVTPDVGGGFGPKGSFYAEYGALAAAALALRAPLKWIEDRQENFLSTQQERDQHWDVEIAVDRDARILGVRGTSHPRGRRLHAVGRGAALDRRHLGAGALCHSEFPSRRVGRLHQQGADLAGARRRPPAGLRGHGAPDGPRRA